MYSWHPCEAGPVKSHREFTGQVSKWSSESPFPKSIHLMSPSGFRININKLCLPMTTNSFLFLLSTLPNTYLPDLPQADRIYRSGNQLQVRCLLLPQACLGYAGVCPRVCAHTGAAQTPWRIPTSPAAPQPHRRRRACTGPHFKINTTLLTLYPDLSPRAWALPRRQTHRLSWAERWACGWGLGLGVDTAGTGPCSPAIFLRDLGQVAGSSGPQLSPLQNVMQISGCTFPVGTDQEFKTKWDC